MNLAGETGSDFLATEVRTPGAWINKRKICCFSSVLTPINEIRGRKGSQDSSLCAIHYASGQNRCPTEMELVYWLVALVALINVALMVRADCRPNAALVQLRTTLAPKR